MKVDSALNQIIINVAKQDLTALNQLSLQQPQVP